VKIPLTPEMLRVRRMKSIVILVLFVALAAYTMYFPITPKPESHTIQLVRISVSSLILVYAIVLCFLAWTGRRIPFSRYHR